MNNTRFSLRDFIFGVIFCVLATKMIKWWMTKR